MGFGLGSRCFYASYNDIIFKFEDKRDRDYFLNHGAKYISAKEVYSSGRILSAIKVKCSQSLSSNKERKLEIKRWKNKQ